MIGIIIADKHELNKFRWNDVKRETKAGFHFEVYEVNNIQVVVAHSGIGIVKSAACAQEMISSYGVTSIYNYGAVGADDTHEVFDIVVPVKVYFHDVITPWYPRGQVPGDVGFYMNELRAADGFKKTNLGTGMEFIDSKEKLLSIQKDLKVGIIDMETAGIMQIAYNNNIPVYVLKCVSDIIGVDLSHIGAINDRITEAGKRAFEEVVKLIEKK